MDNDESSRNCKHPAMNNNLCNHSNPCIPSSGRSLVNTIAGYASAGIAIS